MRRRKNILQKIPYEIRSYIKEFSKIIPDYLKITDNKHVYIENIKYHLEEINDSKLKNEITTIEIKEENTYFKIRYSTDSTEKEIKVPKTLNPAIIVSAMIYYLPKVSTLMLDLKNKDNSFMNLKYFSYPGSIKDLNIYLENPEPIFDMLETVPKNFLKKLQIVYLNGEIDFLNVEVENEDVFETKYNKFKKNLPQVV